MILLVNSEIHEVLRGGILINTISSFISQSNFSENHRGVDITILTSK